MATADITPVNPEQCHQQCQGAHCHISLGTDFTLRIDPLISEQADIHQVTHWLSIKMENQELETIR